MNLNSKIICITPYVIGFQEHLDAFSEKNKKNYMNPSLFFVKLISVKKKNKY